MDNETLRLIDRHASVREFLDKPVEDAVLDKILKAACNGSTMGNMQLFSIIVTRDRGMKEKMALFHFNQPMATAAPVILTFCADFHRFNRYCDCRNANSQAYSNMQAYHWATADAMIAAQNACVAAESLGLGICWLGTIIFNAHEFVKALELPKHVVPVACIAMGYPAAKPEPAAKLNFSDLVHCETYKDYSDERIEDVYRDKEQSAETARVLAENPDLENVAQVITQRRYKQEDNEYFSDILMKTLKDQGFV